MNSANFRNSDRLQRVLTLLRDGKEHTTRDIMRNANVCAVNSCISELRYNGYRIDCIRKNKRFYYKLEKTTLQLLVELLCERRDDKSKYIKM